MELLFSDADGVVVLSGYWVNEAILVGVVKEVMLARLEIRSAGDVLEEGVYAMVEQAFCGLS